MRGKQHNPNDDTRAAVHLMTSRGATQSMAANALGIEEKCLRRHYRDELDGGAVQAYQDAGIMDRTHLSFLRFAARLSPYAPLDSPSSAPPVSISARRRRVLPSNWKR